MPESAPFRSPARLHRSAPVVAAAVVAASALLGAACSGESEPDLSATARSGQALAADNGCVSCHGADGTGGVGPSWVGLSDSEVELEDGSTITADESYLQRAILQPSAELVAGYTVLMPENNLSEDQAKDVVAYIMELE